MNDRFKFRVWNKEQQILHYGAERAYDDMRGDPIIYACCFGELLDNDNYIVEQCTGLKDKNGNLIYEGDIIKDMFGHKFAIKWNQEDVMFDGSILCYDPEYSDRFDLYVGATDDVEIIGNIHEQKDKE